MTRTNKDKGNRRIFAALCALPMVWATIAGCGQGQSAPDDDLLRQKVDEIVLAEIAENGAADYWLVFESRADLSGAAAIEDWNERGVYVQEQLQRAADTAQTLARETLEEADASFETFWIANAIYVKGSDEALLRELVEDLAVARVEADELFEIEPPVEVDESEIEESIDGIEWGVDRIRAPTVWADYGVKGEGIVVANIDTGVDFRHAALMGQYRGNLGNNAFSHDYNWYDPSNVCSGDTPCDNNSHGTHTMGTMVGDDGGSNRIGVAPGATWIAAKGCEYSYCSTGALLASGQWILAPTDRNGNMPRPDLRPHVVNNSWGGGRGNSWYQHIVDAWVAAGIFPAFSAGNSGSSCGTANSPGDYINSYATGALDSGNNIAYFSSRGPSAFSGETKPNISAPGVNVRSSVPNGWYSTKSGTSMASPHTAGAVALLWSAAPALVGDIEGTRAILDQSASDRASTSCGGTAGDNNLYGEGYLDIAAAVEAAPRGPTGTLSGTVRADGGQGIDNARIVVSGPSERATASNYLGAFSLRLPVGSYDISVRAYGYLDHEVSDTVIAQDQDTSIALTMTQAPMQDVSGVVRDDGGNPVAGVRVALPGTPIAPATTDASGRFQLAGVPLGTHTVTVTTDGRCLKSLTTEALFDGVEDVTLTLARRTDAFGYACSKPELDYIEADNRLPVWGRYGRATVDLPFSFPFYGEGYDRLTVCASGYVTFAYSYCTNYNRSIPRSYAPNAAIYPFWDYIYVYYGSVYTRTVGQAPDRQFVIEWRNVSIGGSWWAPRVDFEIILHEGSGDIEMQYRNIDSHYYERGRYATVGIENAAGDIAFQYSYNEAVIESPAFALRFDLPPSAVVEGRVLDLNDGLPVTSATVRVLDEAGAEVQRMHTDADGRYESRVVLGRYTLEASAHNYATESVELNLEVEDEIVRQDFSLATARAEVSTDALSFIVLAGESREQTITLANTGSRDLNFNACPAGTTGWCTPLSWLSVAPNSGTLAPGESTDLVVRVDGAAVDVGVYHAVLAILSDSGRNPRVDVSIDALVVAYRQGVNAGDCTGNDVCLGYLDSHGDSWAPDRMWQPGSWGRITAGSTKATTQPIDGTIEDPLYQTQRVDPYIYRFDALPDGVYQVELEFAELTPNQGPGERLFDVIIDDQPAWPAYDIVNEAGAYTAHTMTFFVDQDDGSLDVQLAQRLGSDKPAINALRITHRPDM